jgi:biotin synthase
MSLSPTSATKQRWTREQVAMLFDLPFNDLLFKAHSVHRAHFDANTVQISTLCSIKTGGCAEDCGYCSQSAHYETEVKASKILDVTSVIEAAKAAKTSGATRFCMGAAWRSPKPRDMEKVTEMIREVKALGLETCATLGMLTEQQAQELKNAGLDYYNHNLDTSPEYYGQIITTRTYQDRLDTLAHVRATGMKTCCGGIIGMGESRIDRVGLLLELANLEQPPESVPINMLMTIDGTPLENVAPLEPFEFIRTIAVARILMPGSYVRLSAGREQMSDEQQALCFFAGANSIFYGEQLLTAANPHTASDNALFSTLGLTAEGASHSAALDAA